MKITKEQIKDMLEKYIVPMHLEEIRYTNFNIEGTLLETQYNIVADMNNKDSDMLDIIYNELVSIPKNERYTFESQIVKVIVENWLNIFTADLYENAKYLFETDIEIGQSFLDKYVNEKLKNKDFALSLDDYVTDIIIDLPFDESDMTFDHYLDTIKYQTIIEQIYEINMGEIVDELDNVVRDAFYEQHTYTPRYYNADNIHLNLFPKQDGNDEGSSLGSFLDELMTKRSEYYTPYYIHNESKNVPEVITWLFDSQGYKIDDIFDSEKVKNSKFLTSFIEEMENIELSCIFLTLMVKMDVSTFEQIQEDITFIVNKNTECGLANPVHGSSSCMAIDLERNIEMTFDFTKEEWQFESAYYPLPYGYSLSSIFGFEENFYKPITIKK